MKLRNKLALIYTIAFTLILVVSFITIYSFSEKYRKEEFLKRLSDRTVTTYKILVHVEQIDNNLLRIFDQNTINSLSNERIYLFDSSKALIYSSTDSGNVSRFMPILAKLDGDEENFEGTMGKYDLLALKLKNKDNTYYGIASAYDKFGIRKIRFLAILLVVTFFIATLLIIFLSFFLSNIITRPISKLTSDVERISPADLKNRIWANFANDEIGFLANRFNVLLDKVENAFQFQFHFINHLSHELKTPLAIMMASAERSLAENETEKIKSSMQFQKNAIMELSHIIDVMLDVSKMEKKLAVVDAEIIRIDEIVFQCMDEMIFLNSNVSFDFNIEDTVEENNLTVRGNNRMLKMAVLNLIKNAVNFSYKEKPSIGIVTTDKEVMVKVTNDGEVLDNEDQSKLFLNSFRGKNSSSVKGFGLGLVLAYRIASIHRGKLCYSIENNRNCFILSLRLAA